MPEPREGRHVTRQVDGRSFDVWPLVWPDGGESWEVRDVASDTLLTMDESLDDNPTDDELRDLSEHLVCKTCGAQVFDTDAALRDHLGDRHHDGAYAFTRSQVRDCYRSPDDDEDDDEDEDSTEEVS